MVIYRLHLRIVTERYYTHRNRTTTERRRVAQCRELDSTDIFIDENVGAVEFTTAHSGGGLGIAYQGPELQAQPRLATPRYELTLGDRVPLALALPEHHEERCGIS